MAFKRKIGNITESSIYVNFENINFRFHDVPGDGNCFYHSVLKCPSILRTYKSVEYLRSFLSSTVLCTIKRDDILIRIFRFFNIGTNLWSAQILTMNEWAKQIDILLFSYLTKVNVISIGNYANGLLSNNMQLLLNLILGNNINDISLNGQLYVYFHIFGSPLGKITNGITLDI